jgi:hypothetical protein
VPRRPLAAASWSQMSQAFDRTQYRLPCPRRGPRHAPGDLFARAGGLRRGEGGLRRAAVGAGVSVGLLLLLAIPSWIVFGGRPARRARDCA